MITETRKTAGDVDMFDFNKTARLIKGGLFEPQSNWQAYLSEANDWKQTARDLTLPLIVGALVLTLVFSFVLRSSFLFSTGIGFGALLVGAVVGFAGFLITAFILALLAGVFKGNNNFDKAFAAVSLTAVPSYAGVVLGTLPWIGGLLSLGLLIYALILLYRIIPDYLAVPPGSRVWHFISSMVAVFVVSLLLASIFGVGMIGAFAESASS
jgi:hypothetical protein